MTTDRERKSASVFAAYFSMHAFTERASIFAWAGSYTPHGRSQCAYTVVFGSNIVSLP